MRKAVPFRITAEIAFFYSLIGALPHFRSWHPQMMAFLAAVFVVGFIAEKIKIMPLRAILALIPGVILFTGEIRPTLFIPALALLYFVIATAKSGSVNLSDYRKAFLTMMCVSGFALLLGIVNTLFIEREPLSAYSIIFPAVFLLFGVSGLRLMQMGDSAGKDLHAAGILTAASTLAVSLAGSFLLYYILRLTLPALTFLGKPLIVLFKYIFSLFPAKETVVNEDLIMDTADEVWDIGELGPAGEAALKSPGPAPSGVRIPPVSKEVLTVLVVLGIVLAAVITIYFVIKLAKRGGDESSDVFYEETEVFTGKKKSRSRAKKQVQLPPAKAIRRIYREYLSYLSKNGITRSETDTSGEILTKSEVIIAADNVYEEDLRNIYIKARYGKDLVTEKDVSEAKKILELITKR